MTTGREDGNEKMNFFTSPSLYPSSPKLPYDVCTEHGRGHFIKRYQPGNIKNVGQLKHPAHTLFWKIRCDIFCSEAFDFRFPKQLSSHS